METFNMDLFVESLRQSKGSSSGFIFFLDNYCIYREGYFLDMIENCNVFKDITNFLVTIGTPAVPEFIKNYDKKESINIFTDKDNCINIISGMNTIKTLKVPNRINLSDQSYLLGSRFTNPVYSQVDIQEIPEIREIIDMKSGEGGKIININNYLMTLFPFTFNKLNKGDTVDIEIYDDGSSIFIVKFIFHKKKKMIISRYIKFAKM